MVISVDGSNTVLIDMGSSSQSGQPVMCGLRGALFLVSETFRLPCWTVGGTATATPTFQPLNRRSIMRRITTLAAVAAIAAGAAACGTTTEQKAATGAVAGAVVGGPVGAAVGGAAGAAVGNAERPN